MVQQDQVSRSTLPGFLLTKLLAMVGSVGLLISLGYLLLQMLLTTVYLLITLLLPVFVIFGMFALIFRPMLGGLRDRPRREQRHSIIEIFGRCVAASLRGAAEVVGRGASMGSSRESAIAEIRRFRLISASGSAIDCELLGEISGPGLRSGDDVQVIGRRQRNGTIRARKVLVLASGGVVTVRLPLAFVATRLIAIAGLGVAVVVAALATSYYA